VLDGTRRAEHLSQKPSVLDSSSAIGRDSVEVISKVRSAMGPGWRMSWYSRGWVTVPLP
jgi:hypothetical protein